MRSILLSSLVAFGLIVGGCAGDDEDEKGSSARAASLDEFCAVRCSAEATCDGDVDEDTCKNECRRAEGLAFENLRSDLVKGIQACIERKDCSDVIGDDVAAACAAEEGAKLTITPAVESLCETARAKVKECEGTGFDLAGCYAVVKPYNDSSLAAAKSCFDKSCRAYNACLSAAINVSID
ncbi:MAG: hypothetical protein MUF34_06815 [Polyangiaceae bacterium]|nr:hypothetical protein [Polyangiaceae bacterium]